MRHILIAALFLTACTKPTQQAEDAVKRLTKDPNATQFRDVQFCGSPTKSTVRGEYNAKNSYGAYAGFETFYYADGRVELQSSGPGRLFRQCLAEMRAETNRITAHTARMTSGQ